LYVARLSLLRAGAEVALPLAARLSPFVARAAVRRPRAAASFGSSSVMYASHVLLRNCRIVVVKDLVTASNCERVFSSCVRSLEKACHFASSNRRSRTISLCGEGRRPSYTGIIHYERNSAITSHGTPFNLVLPEECPRNHALRVSSWPKHYSRIA